MTSYRDAWPRPSFRQACEVFRECRQWLIRQHYADFRQAADCGRILFELALSLTPSQLAVQANGRGLAVARLHPEQQTLLEVAFRLYPGCPVTDLEGGTIHFEPEGQFWLEVSRDAQTLHYGLGWLPYTWCGRSANAARTTAPGLSAHGVPAPA